MRAFVLILVVALLPLRMWAAEGMAVRMAQEQVAAAAGMSAVQAMPEDCPMMAKGLNADAGKGAVQVAGSCLACHLCAASACLPEMASGPRTAPAAPLVSSASGFASADLAPDLRPPIS